MQKLLSKGTKESLENRNDVQQKRTNYYCEEPRSQSSLGRTLNVTL